MKPDFVIRPAGANDLAELAEIHLLGWQLAYADFLPPGQLEAMQVERRLPVWRERLSDPSHLILTIGVGGERIDGFLFGGKVKAHEITDGGRIEGYDCEIYSLHCRRDVQGRGLGRALMAEAARAWAEEGRRALLLWAYADNRFRGFYERLGGKVLARGLDEGVPDLAYGWPDIGRLIRTCEEGRSGARKDERPGISQRRPT
jgi:ribosomal protein S18 acetylase RimI-like enzyme